MNLILQAIKSLLRKVYITMGEAIAVQDKKIEAVKAIAEGAQNSADEANSAAATAFAEAQSKVSSENPQFTGKLSLNRKANSLEGQYSSTLGYNNTVQGQWSYAEGLNNTVYGSYSHAEGNNNTVSHDAYAAHAEGRSNTVSGYVNHAEGQHNTISGTSSHVEGEYNTVSGNLVHASGYYLVATGEYSCVHGKCNVEDTANKYAHIVGNGADSNNRSNAHTLDWEGNAWYAGSVEGTAIILTSSGGKRFNITVDDTGALTAAEITE